MALDDYDNHPFYGVLTEKKDGSTIHVAFFANDEDDVRRIIATDYPESKILEIKRLG